MSTEPNAAPTSSAPPSNGSVSDPPRRSLLRRFDPSPQATPVNASPFPLPTPVMAALATLAFLGVLGWVIWSTQGGDAAREVPLFGGHRFSPSEQVEVESILNAKAIPTTIDPDGVVRVPLEQRSQAQELLGAQELAPRSLEDARRRIAQGGSIFELPEDRARRLHEAREEEARLLLEECPGIASTYVRLHIERARGLAASRSEQVSAFVRVEMEPDFTLDPTTAETIQAILRGLVPGLRDLVLLDARTLARFEWSHDSNTPPQAIAAHADRLKPSPAQASSSPARTRLDDSQPALANSSAPTNNEVRDLQTRLARRLDWLPHAVVRVEIDPESAAASLSDGDLPRGSSSGAPPSSPVMTLNTPIRLPFANPNETVGSDSPHAGPRYDVVVILPSDANTNASPNDPPEARRRLDAEVRRIVAEELPDERRGAVRVEIEPDPSGPSSSSPPSTPGGSRSQTAPFDSPSSWTSDLELNAEVWSEVITAALGIIAAALGLILGWRLGRSRLGRPPRRDPNGSSQSENDPPPWERVRRIVRDHPEVAAGVLSRWLRSGVAQRNPGSGSEFDLETITVGVAVGPTGSSRSRSRE